MSGMEYGISGAASTSDDGGPNVLILPALNDRRAIGSHTKLVVAPGTEGSTTFLEQVHDSFKKTFLKHSQNFVWFEKDELAQEGRVVVAAIEKGAVSAGMYYDRTHFAEVPCIYFKGVFSNSKTRGLAAKIIITAFGYEAMHRKEAFGGLATVREFADGRFNPAAVATFDKLGFRPHSSKSVEITADNRNRHLIPSANVNSDDQCLFKVMHMFCDLKRAKNLIRRGKKLRSFT